MMISLSDQDLSRLLHQLIRSAIIACGLSVGSPKADPETREVRRVRKKSKRGVSVSSLQLCALQAEAAGDL